MRFVRGRARGTGKGRGEEGAGEGGGKRGVELSERDEKGGCSQLHTSACDTPGTRAHASGWLWPGASGAGCPIDAA